MRSWKMIGVGYRRPGPCRFITIAVAVLLAASCSSEDASDDTPSGQPDAAAKKPAVQQKDRRGSLPSIRISKETTFITEPLDEHGYPDYVAAYNAIVGEGVTRENNAAVLLFEALGPKDSLPDQARAEIHRRLGIGNLPVDGPYLVGQWDFGHREASPDGSPTPAEDEFEREWRVIAEGPWTADEAPLRAAWLKENEGPLELVERASRRPRYFVPLVAQSDDGGFITAKWDMPANVTDAARALEYRSRLHLGAGDVDAAWEDILTCFRLAQLVSQQKGGIGFLKACAIDATADEAALELAAHAKLTPEQARRMVADLTALPPLASVAEWFDVENRFGQLEIMVGRCRMARGEGGEDMVSQQWAEACRDGLMIDFNVALQALNRRVGRQVQVCRLTPLDARLRSARQVDEEIDRLEAEMNPPEPELEERSEDAEDSITDFLEGLPDGASREEIEARCQKLAVAENRKLLATLKGLDDPQQRGQYLVDKLNVTLPALLGAPVKCEIRDEARRRMIRLAIALSAWQTEHGALPESLAELAPGYLEEIPADPFVGRPFLYRRIGSDFVLRCVGEDGEPAEGFPDYWRYDEDDLIMATYGSEEAALDMIRRVKGKIVRDETFLVDLSGTETVNSDLKYLRGLPGVEALDLELTDVDDEGMASLKYLKNLKDVRLSYCDISDEGVAVLCSVLQPERISLVSTEVTAESVKMLARLPNLKSLDLSYTAVTDEEMKILIGYPGLEQLELNFTGITDAAVEHLAKLKGLDTISVLSTELTREGCQRLKKALPDTVVIASPAEEEP